MAHDKNLFHPSDDEFDVARKTLGRLTEVLAALSGSVVPSTTPLPLPVVVNAPVVIAAVPPVVIAAPVEIAVIPPVEIAVIPPVEIAVIPPVEIAVIPPVEISNFPATQPVSGTVSVSNFPAVQSVGVVNFPATQPVSGTVTASVSNFPATQPVSGAVSVSNFPATQPVSGTVTASVSNFPATQPVSGAVSVSNFPATQPVSGTVTASVSNFPATQPVSGAVSVSNFPATQPVSGTVTASVSNFPATQPVSAASLPLPAGAATEATLAALSTSNSLDNPAMQASYLGLIGVKTAKNFHVRGRRAGFNSNTLTQDVGEFLGVTIDLLPELTGAESLEVVSSSVNDAAAGTGTRTIKVTYLDGSNNMVQSSAITMNGTTAVALGFTAKFIYWMEAVTGGSSESSAGNILLRIAGGGATHEQISAGHNRSLSGRFMIPTGYTGYVSLWQISAIGGATQDARLRATLSEFDRSLGTRYVSQDGGFAEATSPISNELPWLKFPALCKLKISTISSAAGAANRIDSDFSVLLVAN